jgi:hypothetical protein
MKPLTDVLEELINNEEDNDGVLFFFGPRVLGVENMALDPLLANGSVLGPWGPPAAQVAKQEILKLVEWLYEQVLMVQEAAVPMNRL